MADLQQVAPVDAAAVIPQTDMGNMAVDYAANGLKRAAPEADDSQAPEAKQARLEPAAAQG